MWLHPFTSLTLWAWLTVTAFLLPLPVLAGTAAVTVIAMLTWPVSRPRWRGLALLVIPVGLSLLLVHGGFLAWLVGNPALVEPETLPRVLALWLRLVVVIAAAQIWLAAVPTSRFIRALFASRLPAGVSLVLAGPLLLVEQFRRQLAVIKEAQLARGVPLDGTFSERCRSVPALILPLVSTALQDMTTRSAALDLRAFRAVPRRTTLWGPADTLVQKRVRWGLLAGMLFESAWGIWGIWG